MLKVDYVTCQSLYSGLCHCEYVETGVAVIHIVIFPQFQEQPVLLITFSVTAKESIVITSTAPTSSTTTTKPMSSADEPESSSIIIISLACIISFTCFQLQLMEISMAKLE